jgi:hypothetical protein
MPNSEKIELLISPDALKQFEQLKSSTDANTASFEKLIAKAVELNKAVGNATTFKEINKATQEMTEHDKALAKQIEDLAKANAKLQALYEQQAQKIKALNEEKKKQRDDDKKGADAVTKAEEKLINSYSAEARKLAELREQQTLVNKANKQSAQETLGLAGAYKQLEAQYNKAAQEAKDLAIQFGAGSKQAKEASARALELDARLKAADANTGKFNRNVGNYSGALNTLQKALQDVSKRIDENTKSGIQNEAVMEALQKEQGLLVTLVDAQSKGFANATSEIRNNQQAILLLSQIYGEDSAVVTELTKKTAQLSDTVGDMKATIKAQASDTHVFDGLIGAAQGLVGVYSVAQGAAALFGSENEELQKTFVKLQAVMAVLQGLQSIQNALQKESAARQLINIGLQKVTTIQTSLLTAAESKNIIVRYAAIVAQKALNLAMSAAGGPLLAIIGIITLIVISLKSFAAESQKAAKSLEQLSAEFDRDIKSLENYGDDVKRLGEETIADLERNFASEKEIRDQRSKNLREQFRATFDLEQQYARDVEIQRRKLVKTLKKNTDDLTEEDKKQLDLQDQLIQKFKDVQKKRADLASQIRVGSAQNERATTLENIKARQDDIDVLKTQLQTRLQLQQSIAGDERKTQSERISALKESARIQRELINADANKQLLTPGQTPGQIKVIEAQRTAALTQARRESNKAIEDLNRSYAERERKARFDIIRTEIEDQIKADDLIIANEKNGFDKRLDALYDGYKKRRDIIIAQHDLDIQNDTLTAEERIAIEKKYISDINGLTVEYGLQQQQLYQQNQDQVNAIIEKGQQGRLDKISAQQSLELIALTESFRNGNISAEDYARERANIEQRYRIISLKEEVNNATAKVLATKDGTAERFAAEKELAEKTLALNDEVTAKQIAAQQKLTEVKKQLSAETFATINALVGAQFDKESAAAQAQLSEIDKQKEREIEAANATITNKQEREDAIAKIEAKAQQQREGIERRQRQIELERARFEKAANIAQIIASTAAAIIEALKTYKGTPAAFGIAATIGTIGALQLARAIATPLPKFAEGTDNAPGGLAWVGDAYKKELIVTPHGQIIQTPSVPTVMNVPKHSIVLPDAREALESGLAVNRHGRLVQNDGNNNYKIEQKLDNIAKVIKNKSVLNMSADQGGLTAMWKYGSNWVTYAEDQTRF